MKQLERGNRLAVLVPEVRLHIRRRRLLHQAEPEAPLSGNTLAGIVQMVRGQELVSIFFIGCHSAYTCVWQHKRKVCCGTEHTIYGQQAHHPPAAMERGYKHRRAISVCAQLGNLSGAVAELVYTEQQLRTHHMDRASSYIHGSLRHQIHMVMNAPVQSFLLLQPLYQ